MATMPPPPPPPPAVPPPPPGEMPEERDAQSFNTKLLAILGSVLVGAIVLFALLRPVLENAAAQPTPTPAVTVVRETAAPTPTGAVTVVRETAAPAPTQPPVQAQPP